jgi:serine phosphatase RsbU (regulator of sigma subunit)
MPAMDLGHALRTAELSPQSVPDIVRRLATDLGATDVTLYLVDFAQKTLEPMPDRGVHAEVPRQETVAGSMAGRAFLEHTAQVAERDGGGRVWVPVVEGSDRTGVLAMTVSAADDETVGACETLGRLAGYFIATQARTTDLYNLHRRRKALSLAASMQWDILPPLVLKTPSVTLAGILEPAYEVGGDCFDYALNDTQLNLAIVDAMGHGVTSSLISTLAVGSYRHDRREGRPLDDIHANLDAAMTSEFPNATFATGQLVQIDVETGVMSWTNAGHPVPLLIRNGRVVSGLECPPTPPWGLGAIFAPDVRPVVATTPLEPGDSVLFYTDGVIEAHALHGDPFGLERLIDLAGRHASDQLEPADIVRHIVDAVLDYREGQLADDATAVLVRWNGAVS